MPDYNLATEKKDKNHKTPLLILCREFYAFERVTWMFGVQIEAKCRRDKGKTERW